MIGTCSLSNCSTSIPSSPDDIVAVPGRGEGRAELLCAKRGQLLRFCDPEYIMNRFTKIPPTPLPLHASRAGAQEAGGGLRGVRRRAQGSHVRQEGGTGGEEEESRRLRRLPGWAPGTHVRQGYSARDEGCGVQRMPRRAPGSHLRQGKGTGGEEEESYGLQCVQRGSQSTHLRQEGLIAHRATDINSQPRRPPSPTTKPPFLPRPPNSSPPP